MLMNIPTLTEVAEKIRIPEKEWAGNCQSICEALLASGMLAPELNPRLVKGLWVGDITPNTMYYGRLSVPHAWIEVDSLPDGEYTYVVDPTRHLFEGFEGDTIWWAEYDDSYRSVKGDIAHVVDAFDELECRLQDLRQSSGLGDKPCEPLEALNGIMDKVGRIARLVKHNHRRDPKPNWRAEMEDQLAGVFNYLMMTAACHGVNIYDGLKRELNHAVEDHGA